MKRAMQWATGACNVKRDLFPAPTGVEVYRRVGRDRDVFIIDNVSTQARVVPLPEALEDVLSSHVERAVRLPPFGVAVLLRRKVAED
jgi:beta-galactosidase GanA